MASLLFFGLPPQLAQPAALARTTEALLTAITSTSRFTKVPPVPKLPEVREPVSSLLLIAGVVRFLDDLGNATEIVLHRWARVRPVERWLMAEGGLLRLPERGRDA